MNLFYLDEDFDKSAQYHVDKHIVKDASRGSTTIVYCSMGR